MIQAMCSCGIHNAHWLGSLKVDYLTSLTGYSAAASCWLCNSCICCWKRMGLVWNLHNNVMVLIFPSIYLGINLVTRYSWSIDWLYCSDFQNHMPLWRLSACWYSLSIFFPWSSWCKCMFSLWFYVFNFLYTSIPINRLSAPYIFSF